MINKVVEENSDIDPERIIIGGCSNGGYMTMEMVLTYPELFYKAYPICEAYYDEYITDEQIAAVKAAGTELWFTHSRDDTTVDPTKCAIPTIERMKEAGITVHESTYDHVVDTTGRFTDANGDPYQYTGHWSWIYFDNNYNVCDDCQENEWEWLAAYKTTEDTTKTDTTKKTDTKSPSTGIHSNVGLYVGTFFVTMITLAGVVVIKKKYSK